MSDRVCLLELDHHIVILCTRGRERAALAAFIASTGMPLEIQQVREPESAAHWQDRHWAGDPQNRPAYYLTADGGFTFPFCFRGYVEAEAVVVLQRWKERGRGGRVFRHCEAAA